MPFLQPLQPGNPPSAPRTDWRTVLLLPPRRRFSADELQRARPLQPNRTLFWSVVLNIALPLAVVLVIVGLYHPWHYMLLMVGYVAAAAAVAAVAWRDPTGTTGRIGPWLLPLLAGLATGFTLKLKEVDRSAAVVLMLLLTLGAVGLWLLTLYRFQYIEMRLAERAERERAVEMAQRLASAQLAPHFLFNTLASVQHWVATHDERAGPLLQSLTGYLRSTLPMFARALHPAGDEIEAVRRYLEVMQARLGARLVWSVDVAPVLGAALMPPGLLLTLVENAVEHGIEPLLSGGTLTLRARSKPGAVVFEVQDNGPGLSAGDATRGDGIGLANGRERLLLTHGVRARLELSAAPGGGCLASVHIPV